MNIQNYLSNPMGKGSSVLMLGEARRHLDAQYSELYTKIVVKWYNLQDRYYIAHVKVPSKSVDGLFYDVLLEFDIPSLEASSSNVINDGEVRVFSNCPSFTYTYAYVFNENKNLIDWCRLKYPKEIFEKDPKKRNPYKIVNYEKSLYFAIKYILSGGRNYKSRVKIQAFKIDTYSKIYTQIKTSDKILEEYNIKKHKPTKEKKKENSKKEVQKRKSNTKNGISKSSTTKTTVKTKKTKTTRVTSKTHKI